MLKRVAKLANQLHGTLEIVENINLFLILFN